MPSSLFSALRVASGEGHGMMFRRHPGILESGGRPARRRLLERGPAAVLFKTAGPLGTGIVEQSLSEVFPNRLGAGEPDGVGLLDLDGPPTPAAADPQHVLLYFGQTLRPD